MDDLPVIVTWDPTTKTHPSLGDPQDSEEITIIYQTFVVETEVEFDEEDLELELLVQLPSLFLNTLAKEVTLYFWIRWMARRT